MISDDEYLERVVAGIHAISTNDADVRWNEKINGRQFDVVVRFTLGTLKYLVLIEVKNRTRPASASDIEAFVTKARDQQANKAVFVTMAGFQAGAVPVAKRHGIDLFEISFDKDVTELSAMTNYLTTHNPNYVGDRTPHLDVSEPTLVNVIEGVRLRYVDGQWFSMPDETSQMNYYAAKTLLDDGHNLGDLISECVHADLPEGKVKKFTFELRNALNINPPDLYHYPSGPIDCIEIEIAGRKIQILSGNIGIEPTCFTSPVNYKNVLSGEITKYSLAQLPLNTNPLSPGAFYMQLHPLRYFHCAEVRNGSVTWQLIESFQQLKLIRATYVQDEIYGSFYVPVSDKATIKRLEGRLKDYRALC